MKGNKKKRKKVKKMFKITDITKLEEMGFKKNNCDYVYRYNDDGSIKTCFTVYAGSLYLRYSRTSYVSGEQLKCIYEWTKKNYIEWKE